MKPVLIINLGGTICMRSSEHGLIPDSHVLPDYLNTAYPNNQFEYCEPFELIDSSQANYEYWYQCANFIQKQSHKYRGIIITHGTDTMAYFAAALRFFLKQLNLPIIITGSQIPLSEPNSDAIANINYSIQQIDQTNIQVMKIAIAFNQQLLQSEQTSKVNTQSLDAFAQNHPTVSSKTMTQFDQNTEISELNSLNVSVIWIHPAVNLLTLPIVEANSLYIIKSYGAGNLPKNNELEDFFKKVNNVKSFVVNHSQCFHANIDMSLYEAGSWLEKYNVISAKNLTLESLIAKSRCIDINHFKDELLKPSYFEFS